MLSTNYKYASGIELKNFRIRIYNYIFVHFSVDENVLRNIKYAQIRLDYSFMENEGERIDVL